MPPWLRQHLAPTTTRHIRHPVPPKDHALEGHPHVIHHTAATNLGNNATDHHLNTPTLREVWSWTQNWSFGPRKIGSRISKSEFEPEMAQNPLRFDLDTCQRGAPKIARLVYHSVFEGYIYMCVCDYMRIYGYCGWTNNHYVNDSELWMILVLVGFPFSLQFCGEVFQVVV